MEEKRKVCEKQMMWLLDKLIEVYHEYNPNGNYLSICYNNDDGDNYRHFNNRDWEGGDDEQFPMSYSEWTGKGVI